MRHGLELSVTVVSLFALANGQIPLPSPENIEKAKAILEQYPVVDGLVHFL